PKGHRTAGRGHDSRRRRLHPCRLAHRSAGNPDENIFAMYRQVGIAREDIFDKAADVRKSLGS
ncbi:MAG: hypothetical protein QF792_06280, partial [Phycisphaerae bacterium]|nr:hypothetical protein [Phycisphaerae bacterium]